MEIENTNLDNEINNSQSYKKYFYYYKYIIIIL